MISKQTRTHAVLKQMIFLQAIHFYIFAAEVIHPPSLTSVYNQISNSTLTAAYQHGEGLTLMGFWSF